MTRERSFRPVRVATFSFCCARHNRVVLLYGGVSANLLLEELSLEEGPQLGYEIFPKPKPVAVHVVATD